MSTGNVNPSELIKQIEKEIQSDTNFSSTLQKLISYYDNYEKVTKSLDGNYLKIKAFILMIDGKYQEALNLKSKLSVIIFLYFN